jgi:hypothetical protein
MALVDPNAPPRLADARHITNGFDYDDAAPMV